MAAFLRTIAVDLADTFRVKRGGMAKWNDGTDTLPHVDVDEINQYDRYCSMRRLVQTEKGYMALAYSRRKLEVLFLLSSAARCSMYFDPSLEGKMVTSTSLSVNATYKGL
jgi:hypothetical protein